MSTVVASTSWPEAAVYIAFFAFMAVIVWSMNR